MKIVKIEKEMHNHKLSAMADNYPADWCKNYLLPPGLNCLSTSPLSSSFKKCAKIILALATLNDKMNDFLYRCDK